MADVLIVCVREDEPKAKALADMFEAAGFSIGGAPSSDAGLRSSGAGVVVWSQASIRSRPFLDAAQRVINANKAVVASLIEPPPPSSIGDSAAFDLSLWDGDPNDPALDPLFFAVDRMVNAARAGVGAAQPRAEPDYEPPPPVRAAPPRAPAPMPPPQPAYRAPPPPPADPLGSEAEHWRAIRDSRDPADFMDYLARYGPDGAFSEVAELRLKQLTGPGENRAPAAPARPAAAPIRPTVHTEPPRRMVEPTRPPPQPARRVDPSRRPPPDRDYARDLREPPKGEGGPLRAFVLIALLGGAALAGGLYFGGALGDFGASTPRQEPIETAAMEIGSTEPVGESFSDLAEAPSVPLSETTRRPTEIASRANREPSQPRSQPARDPEPPPAAQTRPASTSGAAASTSGGPVSLSPGSSEPQVAAPIPLRPLPGQLNSQTATTTPRQTQGPAPEVRAPAGSVVWAQRPSARRIAELYPSRALRDGVGGRVQLDCRVQSNLSVACSIVSETPAGEGFGRAAIAAAGSYRARATLSNGASAVGSHARIAVNFQAPQ